MPGTAAGTVSSRQATVASATSCRPRPVCPQDLPLSTMLGLRSVPGKCDTSGWHAPAGSRPRAAPPPWSPRSTCLCRDRRPSAPPARRVGTRPSLLAERGEPCKSVGVRIRCSIGRRHAVPDGDDGPPLGESGAQRVAYSFKSLGAGRPSPSVTVSPSAPARGLAPLSTLMPGMMSLVYQHFNEQAFRQRPVWRIVSSNRITPLMKCSPPLRCVNSISR